MKAALLCVSVCSLGLVPARAQCPDGRPPPCAPTLRPSAPPPNSVAVLYFENLSRDTADAYLPDGLTEEVTARLGQVGRLVVTSRTAARRLRAAAAAMSPPEIGRALNAAYLVNGSVRRAGERLRVTVELLRASTGVQVWSDQFDRGTEDLLAIQERIAVAVAAGVTGRVLPAERARLTARPTRSAAAYDLYLRGSRAAWEASPAAVQFAISSLEAALELDARFTAARGRLAYVYGWAANWAMRLSGVEPESLIARGLAAADQALREDSTSSDAWLGRGFLLFFRDPPDYGASLAALRAAVTLDSINATAHHTYASMLRRLGHFGESDAAYHRALAADPTLGQALADVGLIALSHRRFEEARPWYDSALVVNPGAWQHLQFRSLIAVESGEAARALTDAQDAVRFAPPALRHQALLVHAIAHGRLGDRAKARAILEPVQAGFASGPLTVRDGWPLALALVAVDDHEGAIAALERVRPRGAWLWSYLVFPGFDPIRGDPRFQRIYEEARPPGAPRLP